MTKQYIGAYYDVLGEDKLQEHNMTFKSNIASKNKMINRKLKFDHKVKFEQLEALQQKGVVRITRLYESNEPQRTDLEKINFEAFLDYIRQFGIEVERIDHLTELNLCLGCRAHRIASGSVECEHVLFCQHCLKRYREGPYHCYCPRPDCLKEGITFESFES